MSAKQRAPLYHWKQELIDAYNDYKRSGPVDQWHLVLDSLCKEFQSWRTGEVSHPEWIKPSMKRTENASKSIVCSQVSVASGWMSFS